MPAMDSDQDYEPLRVRWLSISRPQSFRTPLLLISEFVLRLVQVCNLLKNIAFPSFAPHPLLNNQHSQTIAAMYLPATVPHFTSSHHVIDTLDGDRLALHEDEPVAGALRQRAVLLIHGLGGSHMSPYVHRIAYKLTRCGIRSFRMDMRGWGKGFRLSREWSHAGRSDDILASLQWIRDRYPDCELRACGFSLGANMLLKLLTEHSAKPPAGLQAAMAVAPPIHLATCVRRLNRGILRIYDRFFARKLWQAYLGRSQFPHVVQRPLENRPKSLLEFDTLLTAPLGNFSSVEEYYKQCSSEQNLCKISVPTWIVTSKDDPLIPVELFSRAKLSDNTRLDIIQAGGHLGFVARSKESTAWCTRHVPKADHRWLDWRVVEFGLIP